MLHICIQTYFCLLTSTCNVLPFIIAYRHTLAERSRAYQGRIYWGGMGWQLPP